MKNFNTTKKQSRTRESGLTNNIHLAIKGIKFSVLILMAILMIRCTDFMDDDYTYIDPSLKIHVDTFVKEAQRRGIYINTNGLKIDVKSIDGKTSGRCFFQTKQIWIDTTKTLNVEALVFHELGHLYLHRDHDNKMYGIYCKSIMSDVKDPVFDKEYKRKYYIDELFNETEPEPFWISGSVLD